MPSEARQLINHRGKAGRHSPARATPTAIDQRRYPLRAAGSGSVWMRGSGIVHDGGWDCCEGWGSGMWKEGFRLCSCGGGGRAEESPVGRTPSAPGVYSKRKDCLITPLLRRAKFLGR